MLSFFVLAVAVCPAAQPAGSPQLSKERFSNIATNLETGGDLLIVANVEGYLEGLVRDITQLILSTPDKDAGSNAGRQLLAKIPGFLQKNGFFAVRGFGASVVPRADGLNTVKAFIDRDPAAMDLPLWRGFFGTPSQSVNCAAFLPADTVLVRTGNGDLSEMWKLFRAGVVELASPAASSDFNKKLSNLSTNMGVDLDKVFASLSGDGFLSIQFSKTATVEIPSKGSDAAPIQMPRPSLLICVAVKDDSLLKAIQAPLNRVKMPVVQTQLGAVVVSSINIPTPSPFPLEPSFAVCSNFFLFGSTAQVVTDAIKAFSGKNGLIATVEFKKAFEGLPPVNNGVFYMNRRLTKTITDIQMAALDSATGEASSTSAIREMVQRRGEMESAFVFQNLKGGILISGTSTAGGKELVGGLMAAPIGLVAAIAIPSFIKARDTAQRNACINNLRMIDSGKEQAALAERWGDEDEVDVEVVNQYLKDKKTPICPQGGTYTYGKMNESPKCSIPGHSMPTY